VRVDDTDTNQLQAATHELEALVLHEQACHLGDVRALLVELYERDGVAIEDGLLDAQTQEVAAQERGARFLQELATRLHPGDEPAGVGPRTRRSCVGGVAGDGLQPGG